MKNLGEMANATERALRRKRKRKRAVSASNARTTASPKSTPIQRNIQKRTKKYTTNPGKNPNFVPLGDNALLEGNGLLLKSNEEEPEKKKKKEEKKEKVKDETFLVSTVPASQQLRFFLNRFQSACGFRLSPLELEPIKDTSIVELLKGVDQNAESFSKHIKHRFKNSWKEELCKGNLVEGKVDPGSPSILIVTASALRSLELLRGLKPLTRDCRPVKLFAKHMKLEEQITLLKSRVNIVTGTPSRIKKLIEIDALSLSRLCLVVIDMQRDAKGYSLFTLPQVSNEFWELYKFHFHQKLGQGGDDLNLRICFYGPMSVLEFEKALRAEEE